MTTPQIALVTGGARGIGAAICRVLAAAGHRVAVTDVAIEGAETLAKEIGGKAFAMDVTSAASVNAVAARVAAETNRRPSWLRCSAPKQKSLASWPTVSTRSASEKSARPRHLPTTALFRAGRKSVGSHRKACRGQRLNRVNCCDGGG